MNSILPLCNPIRNYDWGSHTAIAQLLGRPTPSPDPEAELWLGAHEVASSEVETADGWRELRGCIASDPDGYLGRRDRERFDARLPFLLKVLATERALSLQTHPDGAQAREGYQREESEGVPANAPTRSYRDASSKPELICALTPFQALCGFRPAGEVAELLRALEEPALTPLLEKLAHPDPEAALRGFLSHLLTTADDARSQIALAAARGAERRASRHGDDDCAWVLQLAQQHPNDASILAPLFLNRFELRPGTALFLQPGSIHAYLVGTGIEIMANSDNVLRAGLTSKHINVSELMAALRFDGSRPAVLAAGPAGEPGQGDPVTARFETPVDAFELCVLRPRRGEPARQQAGHGVEILLCVEGSASLVSQEGPRLPLARGESLLVAASAPGYRVEATQETALIYRAGVPR